MIQRKFLVCDQMRDKFSHNSIHYISNYCLEITQYSGSLSRPVFKSDFVRLHFVDSAIPGVVNASLRCCKLGCKIPERFERLCQQAFNWTWTPRRDKLTSKKPRLRPLTNCSQVMPSNFNQIKARKISEGIFFTNSNNGLTDNST